MANGKHKELKLLDDYVNYNGKNYAAPNAAWTSEAPSEWRETPERLEQMWTLGYGGKGYKEAENNYANMSPLEQAIFDNATKKAQAREAAGDMGNSYGGGSKYEDSYAGQIKALTDKIMNRGPFSYDYAADPLYKQYEKEYTRLGRRAMDDTLAKISARTGGLASSYAATAGNQAYGNYMQELSNKIPELYKLAYDMYSDDYNRDLNRLNLLRGLDSDAYGRFASERAYGDSRSDLAYNRELAAANQDYERSLAAADLLAQYGDMSGLEGVYGLNGLQDRYNEANAVYAFADDGTPYMISSTKGQSYLNSLQPGQSVRGGDGSTWTRNIDGSFSITDQSGRTYKIAATTAIGGRGGGGNVKTPEDMIDYDSNRGKSLVSASQNNPALAQQYLSTYWDNMGYVERFSLLQNMGYDNQSAMDLAREGGLSGKDFNAYLAADEANKPKAADDFLSDSNLLLQYGTYNNYLNGTPANSSNGGYGTAYSNLYGRARGIMDRAGNSITDQNAAIEQVKTMLNGASESELTDAGMAYILRALGIA